MTAEHEEALKIVSELRANESQLTEEQKNVLARYETKLMAQEPAPKQEMSAAGKFMAPMVLPTAGSVALPAALTAAAGPANVPFIPLEQGVGSGMGTLGNYALGLEKPSLSGLAASVALPIGVGYGVNALRYLKNISPTASGAKTMNKLGHAVAAGKAEQYAPVYPAGVTSSKDLFKLADKSGTAIPTSKTESAILDVLDDMGKPSKGAQAEYGRAMNYVKGLQDKLNERVTMPGVKPTLTPSEMQAELHALGEITADFKQKGGPGLKYINQIKTALVNDLDEAVKSGSAGAQSLKEARKFFLREATLDEMVQNIDKRYILKRGVGDVRQFNANKVIEDLQSNPFFEKAFDAAERKDIFKTMKLLNKLPPLPPAQGVQFGSGRIATMMSRAGIGGGMGAATGSPELATALAVAGAASGPTTEIAKNFWVTLWTKEGRSLAKELLTNSDGALTPYVASTLAAYVRAKTMGASPQPEP